jgi:hypothetical protein
LNLEFRESSIARHAANVWHPAISILMVIAIAILTGSAGPAGLGFGATITAGCYAACGIPFDRNWLRALVRLRWLMFSILIFYLLFTPDGSGHVAALPDVHKLRLAMMQCGFLLVLASAVHWLLAVTGREALIAGLLYLLAPVSNVGFRQRLALRLALTLEALGPARARCGNTLTSEHATESALQRWEFAGAMLFNTALERAEGSKLIRVRLDGFSRPPLYQWLFPVIVVVIAFVLP